MSRVAARVLDAAIAWRLRLESSAVCDADREAFAHWLGLSPEHERVWQRFDALDARFAGASQPVLTALQRQPRRRGAGVGAFALALSLVCVFLLTARPGPVAAWLADERTDIGEVRALTLADNTHLTLDTRSAVDIDFSAQRRRVVLHAGSILVETGHGDARPFLVQTGEGELRPLGTRFVVRRDARGTQLTVLQDVVAAHPRAAPELRVKAGQTLQLRPDALPRPALAGAEAWAYGMLAADNSRLADIAAELSRYRRDPLAVDPRLAERRVTGSFPLHDPELTFAALGQTLPLRVQRDGKGLITLMPRDE